MARNRTTRPKGNGAGKGDGLYGPAKGRTMLKPLGGKDSAYSEGVRAKSRDPDVLATKEARAAELQAHLENLAFTAEREETRVTATVAALNRLEGLPVQKVDTTVRRSVISDKPMAEDEWIATYGVGATGGPSESPH